MLKELQGKWHASAACRFTHVVFVFTSKNTRKDTSKKGVGQGLREGANARGDNTKHYYGIDFSSTIFEHHNKWQPASTATAAAFSTCCR